MWMLQGGIPSNNRITLQFTNNQCKKLPALILPSKWALGSENTQKVSSVQHARLKLLINESSRSTFTFQRNLIL